MIYVDTSVLLAHVFDEERQPPTAMWDVHLVTSRLTEYELWTRVHALRRATSHGEHVRAVLDRVAFLELTPTVLARAIEPFGAPVRTLDALHLASVEFLRARRQDVQLASYDERQLAAARRLGIDLYSLSAA